MLLRRSTGSVLILHPTLTRMARMAGSPTLVSAFHIVFIFETQLSPLLGPSNEWQTRRSDLRVDKQYCTLLSPAVSVGQDRRSDAISRPCRVSFRALQLASVRSDNKTRWGWMIMQ